MKEDLIDDVKTCPQCLKKSMVRKEVKSEDSFLYPIYVLEVKCSRCDWASTFKSITPVSINMKKGNYDEHKRNE